jgi:putative salt-induced outer membrane protein YdiY
MYALFLAALVSASTAEAARPEGHAPPPVSPAVLPVQDEDEEEELTLNEWNGSISLGAGWTGGNSKTEGASASVDAQYRREIDRTTLKLFYEYQSSDDVRLKDNYFADAKYDYFLTDATYLWGQLRAEVNTLAGLKLRKIAGAGLGHQFADSDTFKLSGEAGLSYIDEEFRGGVEDDYMAARLAYDLDWIPNDRWSFGQSTDFYPSLDDTDVWYVVVDNFAKVHLTDSMFGQLKYLFQHVEQPSAGAKQDDHTVQLTVGWDF